MKFLSNFVYSFVISAPIVEVLAGLGNSKNKSRFSLTHNDENRFTINQKNTKNVTIKVLFLKFPDIICIVYTYKLPYPDLSFICQKQLMRKTTSLMKK